MSEGGYYQTKKSYLLQSYKSLTAISRRKSRERGSKSIDPFGGHLADLPTCFAILAMEETKNFGNMRLRNFQSSKAHALSYRTLDDS